MPKGSQKFESGVFNVTVTSFGSKEHAPERKLVAKSMRLRKDLFISIGITFKHGTETRVNSSEIEDTDKV